MDKAIAGATKDEKIYRNIDTKFFNMHFSVPGKDGKFKRTLSKKEKILSSTCPERTNSLSWNTKQKKTQELLLLK